jgi:hypothetical protein
MSRAPFEGPLDEQSELIAARVRQKLTWLDCGFDTVGDVLLPLLADRGEAQLIESIAALASPA